MGKLARIVMTTGCIALFGCGGGGGDNPLPEDGGQNTADLQTTVPAPTYPADLGPFNGAGALELFNYFNQIRQHLGMGLLAQNTRLDTAAANHAEYAVRAGGRDPANAIEEDTANAFFTGAMPQDRCTAVGYAGQCPLTAHWTETGYALHPSPYLGLTMLSQGAREIGIAMTDGPLFGAMTNGPVVQLGFPDGIPPQRQAAGFLLVTYLWGAFHIHINEGQTLTVDTFQVRDATDMLVEGQLLTHANDPLHRVPLHAAMLTTPPGREPYCDGSTYTVHFAGKRDGVGFTETRTLTLRHPAPDSARVFCIAS